MVVHASSQGSIEVFVIAGYHQSRLMKNQTTAGGVDHRLVKRSLKT